MGGIMAEALADALEACTTVRDARRDSIHAEVPLDMHARSIALLRRMAAAERARDGWSVWDFPVQAGEKKNKKGG